MSADWSLARLHMSRFGYTLLTVFVGTLTTGTLAVTGFMPALCFSRLGTACFSLPIDFTGFMWKVTQMWFVPTLGVALLIATIVQFRGSVTGWNVILVAALVSVAEFARLVGRMGELGDVPYFLAFGLVLFIGIQLSRLITRWIGKYPI